MAKSQGREKPAKKRTKEGPRTRVRTKVKQTALLASPIDKGQAQGEEKKKTYKKRSQNWAGGLSFCIFWIGIPSVLKDVFSFTFKIKLSCNTEL